MNPKLLIGTVQKFMVEMFGVERFMVENLGLKCPGLKLGVEKSGVEMSNSTVQSGKTTSNPCLFQKKGPPHDFTVNILIHAHTRPRTRTHARAPMHVRAAIAADV